MNDKDRFYWEGIAKATAESKLQPRDIDADEALQFLDAAYLFVLEMKGEVAIKEPTEVEFYKKLVNLSKRKMAKH